MSSAYTPTPNGKPIVGPDVQQLINGVTGIDPHVHTFRNDGADHAVTIQSRATADGGPHLRVLKSDDDSVLFEVTDDGVNFPTTGLISLALPGTFSVDGASTFNGAVTFSNTTNFTNSNVFSGAVALSNTLTLAGPGAYTGLSLAGLSVIENVSGSPTWGLQRVFTPEMYGAKRTGQVDDYSALQKCIDDAKAVAGIVQLSHGYYLCSQPLLVNNANGLTIRGPMAGTADAYGRCTIRFTSGISGGVGKHLMEFVGSHNILLEGFNVKGDSAADVAGPAIGVAGITSAGTGLFFAPANGVTEGGQHIVMKRMEVSGPFSVAAVYAWSTFYHVVENCGLFVNGSNNTTAALAITSVNYGGLYSSAVRVQGGATDLLSADNSYAASHIDGARHVSVRDSLVYNQNSASTNIYGIYLDTVRAISIRDSEPTNNATVSTSCPSIAIKDSAVASQISEQIIIENCQMGSGASAMIELLSAKIVRNLSIINVGSGNLVGPILSASLDGGGFRGLVLRGFSGFQANTPSHLITIACSDGNRVVLADCEIHCTVHLGGDSVSPLAIDVNSGVIGGSTKLYAAGTISAAGGCRAELMA